MADFAHNLHLVAVQIHVVGKVQGVYFRANTAKKAQALNLQGWVKNLNDGSVQIWAQGDSEAVEQLIQWCHRGPILAKVSKVSHTMADYDHGIGVFDILR